MAMHRPAGEPLPERSGSARRLSPRLARAARIALAVVALVVLVVPAVSVARWSWHAGEPRSELRVASLAVAGDFNCAAAAVRRDVPAGSVAYIREDQPGPYGVLWYQRLVEMTYPVATVVGDPAGADVEVEILEVPQDQGCRGAQVNVKRLR